jgi:hypothetical protein
VKKKKIIDPQLKQILTELEEVVMRVGYKVRYEKGNFEGGYCVLRDSSLIVVNNRSGIEKRISIVSRCLKEIGVDDIFVKPNIREVIETESSKPREKNSDEDGVENTGSEENEKGVNEENKEDVNEETANETGHGE